jgi:hypothetical protein
MIKLRLLISKFYTKVVKILILQRVRLKYSEQKRMMVRMNLFGNYPCRNFLNLALFSPGNAKEENE